MDRRKKGSGQITHVPGRKSPWRASVVDSTGKQKSRFFKTEKEAKAFLREVNADANKLKSLLETGVTFSAFSTIFLEEKSKQNLKPTAYKALLDSVNRANEYVGRVLLRDIDSDMVQQMIYDLAKQGYSESIMTKAKQAVGSVLKMAAAKHYLDAVPVIDVIIPTAKNQDANRQAKSNWMRDDEIRAYEEECKRTYVPKKYTKYAGKELLYHTAGYKLLFILHTGLRVGEALALTWADYDDYSKTILIDKNMVYVDGEKITQTPKTESGERVIVLNNRLCRICRCFASNLMNNPKLLIREWRRNYGRRNWILLAPSRNLPSVLSRKSMMRSAGNTNTSAVLPTSPLAAVLVAAPARATERFVRRSG